MRYEILNDVLGVGLMFTDKFLCVEFVSLNKIGGTDFFGNKKTIVKEYSDNNLNFFSNIFCKNKFLYS